MKTIKSIGIIGRFTHKLAIAPTASISIILNNTSPSIDPYIANIYNQKNIKGNHTHKNKFLIEVLKKYGKDDKDTWQSILLNQGSVQHLSFLSDLEKQVFKTAFEIDQKVLIKLASIRQQYICQSQSLNLFIRSDENKGTINKIHMMAWEKGIKSLYYVRSMSVSRPDDISSSNEACHISSSNEECQVCE